LLKDKVQKSAKEIENNRLKYFLWPAIVIPLLVGIIPYFTGIGLSFTNWKLALSNIRFVGLRNYIEMFSNPDFWNALKVTGIFSGVSLFIEIIIGFFVGWLLSVKLKGISFFRSIILIPLMVAPVLSALMWKLMLPSYGVINDTRKILILNDPSKVFSNFMSIGGERGWYHATWLWRCRGFLDTLFKGVGLRRGRTHPTKIEPGDSLDFWRVLVADNKNKRLLLYGEMKTPGETWLEFSIKEEKGEHFLYQKITFRPTGLLGRLYWYITAPIHLYIFPGMIKKIEQYNT
jgi:hypothetical protein